MLIEVRERLFGRCGEPRSLGLRDRAPFRMADAPQFGAAALAAAAPHAVDAMHARTRPAVPEDAAQDG